MLIVALVLAVIGLAALVTAVVTSNELIAWVCIGASVIGVVLLIVDALRERSRGDADSDPGAPPQDADEEFAEDYPDDTPAMVGGRNRRCPSGNRRQRRRRGRRGRQQPALTRRFSQQFTHLVIGDLVEVCVDLSDRLERLGHRRAHHIVGLAAELVCRPTAARRAPRPPRSPDARNAPRGRPRACLRRWRSRRRR